jgi:hypothetical protein
MPTPKAVLRKARAHFPALEELFGVKFGDPLGHGHWGVVFATSDPSKVFKISIDPTEGPIIQTLIDTNFDKRHEGLADFYAVVELPDRTKWWKKSYRTWAILRENIMPRPQGRQYEYERAGKRFEAREEREAIGALFGYLQASRDFLRLKSWARKQEAEGRMNQYLGALYGTEVSYFVAEVIENIREELGIILADVHASNVGYRVFPTQFGFTPNDLHWVIFDPGHSSLEKEPKIKRLVLPKAVAKNPVPKLRRR